MTSVSIVMTGQSGCPGSGLVLGRGPRSWPHPNTPGEGIWIVPAASLWPRWSVLPAQLHPQDRARKHHLSGQKSLPLSQDVVVEIQLRHKMMCLIDVIWEYGRHRCRRPVGSQQAVLSH